MNLIMNIPHMRCPEKSGHIDPDFFWLKTSLIYLQSLRRNKCTFKHIVFENMSHAAVVHLPWIYKMAFKSERRHPKECAKDRKRMKMELLAWVKDVWQ